MSRRTRPTATPDLFEPLDDAELDWLDHFLLHQVDEDVGEERMDEGLITVSELEGLFTAIVSGPVVIPPSRWLPTVWGEFEPVWDSQADIERVLTLMLLPRPQSRLRQE